MGKHRQYTPEFKARIVLEVLKGEKSQAQICRENNVKDDMVTYWRREFLEHAADIFSAERTRSAEQQRIVELERLVGQLTLELSILKKVSALLDSPGRRNGNSS